MTLLDTQEPDPKIARKRKTRIIVASVLVIVVLSLGPLGFVLGHGWWFSYWPKERVVGKFFDALQKQDYKTAYGIWMHDPEWQKHPERYVKYPFGDFYRDWGPGGEWGIIRTQKVFGASTCPGPGGSGIVVDVVVNDRAEHAQVWYEKSDDTLSYPPCELMFH
jgi:hypothetical protein